MSASKSLKSTMWRVELTSDFPTGAGIQLRSPEPDVVTFLAPWHTSPEPLWWHFQIRGAQGRQVRFVWKNARQCLGGATAARDQRMFPILTEDSPDLPPSRRRWRRVRRQDIAYDETNGAYNFSFRIGSPVAWVAFCYPYGLAEWDELCRDLSGPLVKISTLGRSAGGRPLPQLRLTDPQTPDAGKRVVWLLARNHAAEVGGAWALDGLLRWLASGQPAARQLRQRLVFRVVPMVDVDGVAEGVYGKERAPVDFNRAWLADSPRPEIRLIQQAMDTEKLPGAFHLDFHSPAAGDTNQVFLFRRGTMPDSAWNLSRQWADWLCRECPGRVKPREVQEPTYYGYEAESLCRAALFLTSAAAEVSYGYNGPKVILERQDYQEFGASVGRALFRTLKDAPTATARETLPLCLPHEAAAGTAFTGAFLLHPPRDAEVKVVRERGADVLRLRLKKKTAQVHVAGPRSDLPPDNRVKLPLCFKAGKKKSGVAVMATVFYYAANGRRYLQDEKAWIQPGDTPAHGPTLDLAPPAGAVRFRVCLGASGGPANLHLYPLPPVER